MVSELLFTNRPYKNRQFCHMYSSNNFESRLEVNSVITFAGNQNLVIVYIGR